MYEDKSSDHALEFQPVTIQLSKELIERYRLLGSYKGVAEQALMQNALDKFADKETKSIVNQAHDLERTYEKVEKLLDDHRRPKIKKSKKTD